jgi:hypothetical protein
MQNKATRIAAAAATEQCGVVRDAKRNTRLACVPANLGLSKNTAIEIPRGAYSRPVPLGRARRRNAEPVTGHAGHRLALTCSERVSLSRRDASLFWTATCASGRL